MNDFFYLIPISVLLGAAGLAIFLWTLQDGQYEDLDGAAQRILYEEDTPRPVVNSHSVKVGSSALLPPAETAPATAASGGRPHPGRLRT